jgi:Mor family transcriptional regulator
MAYHRSILSNEIKSEILTKVVQGHKIHELAAEYNTSKVNIYNTLRKYGHWEFVIDKDPLTVE